MDEFRGKDLEIECWEVHAPDTKFRGVIRVDDGNNGTLKLTGDRDSLGRLDRTSATLFGILRKYYDYRITVFNIVMTHSPTPQLGQDERGLCYSTFDTNNIVLGSHIISEDELIVSSMLFIPTGLSEWCSTIGITGARNINQSGELATESVNIAFQATSTPFYEIGTGKQLRFLSQYSGPNVFGDSKTVSFKEYNSIQFNFERPVSLNDLVREIQTWQTFFTFALRHASYTDEVRFNCLNEKNGAFGTALLLAGRRRSDSSRARRGRLLFDQSKLGAKLGNYLKAWADLQAQIEIPMLLFSAADFQAQSYIHVNLLSYLS